MREFRENVGVGIDEMDSSVVDVETDIDARRQFDRMESLQLLNTAIIKSKERKMGASYEERLKGVCQSPVIEALEMAVSFLAETQGISRDQSAMQVVETIKELDEIWSDYMMMEGIDCIKGLLSGNNGNKGSKGNSGNKG
ncbi:MAG: hypothetical protein HQK53_05240 [Oligoflexia bacterium]|nr:hypothetical protein [Oligoflexia bacterium]